MAMTVTTYATAMSSQLFQKEIIRRQFTSHSIQSERATGAVWVRVGSEMNRRRLKGIITGWAFGIDGSFGHHFGITLPWMEVTLKSGPQLGV